MFDVLQAVLITKCTNSYIFYERFIFVLRRTTLSIATSLESEYVPPHAQNSPSPVIGRLTRAQGLASSCEDDTDHEQVKTYRYKQQI